jgi:acetyl esterase/lipase
LKIYRISVLLPQLLIKLASKPEYISLFFWAYQQLSWVDKDLKNMTIEALKDKSPERSSPLNVELQREIRQRAIAIEWTAKIHHLRPKCLHRSLALYHYLKQQGIHPQLEIGWGDNIGHAWISYNGKVLNDRADIANVTPRLSRV